ncbi:MAG: 4Fe-4S binding protein [Anaerolineae bacterium]
MSARSWQRIRRAVQAVSLLVYLVLFVLANAQRPHRIGPDLFTRLDPLLMGTAMVAGRVWIGGLWLAMAVLFLTLLFGRVWCGWLCPLGTLLEWLTPQQRKATKGWRSAPADGWRRIKYLIVFLLFAAALLGNQTLIWLDPITTLHRTMTTAFWPALRYAVVEAERFLYRFPFLWGPLDGFHHRVVYPLFQGVQPYFGLGLVMAFLFVGLVILSQWAERFWCRYLCPLGGLLGLVSKLALLRREVSERCMECAGCAHRCPTGTIDPQRHYRSDPAECIMCLECLIGCRDEALGFRWQLLRWRIAEWRGYDPTRRTILAAAGASAVGVTLLAIEPGATRGSATLIRPPGATLVDFSSRCIRCGACLRVCPTQGLQPSLWEGGIENLLTPRLVPRLGPCSFACNACGQVCPTGAIPRLSLDKKRRIVMGLARVDRDRCFPWAYGVACIVCEETCPIADKAIHLEDIEVRTAQGEIKHLQAPRVIQERCIGCGQCEYQCPVGGEAAIRVFRS